MIDANLEKPVWEKAEGITGFQKLRRNQDVKFECPVFSTNVRCLWDDLYLYICFDCESHDVWASKTKRDDELWTEPVVEVFLDPLGKAKSFFEFQVNPLGTIYDSFVPDADKSSEWQKWCKWKCEGLQIAVKCDGKLNDRSHRDNGWQVEMAIPFAALAAETGVLPRSGVQWRANFCRYEIPAELPKQELSTWAHVIRKFDDLKRFGYIKFV